MIDSQSTLDLERELGSPFEPSSPLSFGNAMTFDEAEAYPEPSCAFLDSWGLAEFYIPTEYGGKLRSHQELFSLIRVVASRDMTAAIAHAKTYLGSLPIWIAGTRSQANWLAEIVRSYGQVAFALTEQNHGTDLLAIETEIRTDLQGDSLHGTKWLINNATRSRAVVVLARLSPIRSAASLCLLLIDKQAYEPAVLCPLPRVRTLGVRGADISGLAFSNLRVSDSQYVGARGTALETILRVLQVSRTLCTALSLGIADTALRTALKFSVERQIYNGVVFDLPYVRRALVTSFADLLACDCVVLSAARTIDGSPRELSYRSAIAKALVPEITETMLRQLAKVIGARFYLREDLLNGLFQKLLRDHALVGLFDGSTTVNLEMLALQLRHLLREPVDPPLQRENDLKALFDLSQPLGPINFHSLSLANAITDVVLTGLESMPDALEDTLQRIDPDISAAIRRCHSVLKDALHELRKEIPGHVALEHGRAPVRLIQAATRYLNLHAAAVCIRLWVFNRHQLDSFFNEGRWLILVLTRLLADRLPDSVANQMNSLCEEVVVQELLRRFRNGTSLSIIPLKQHQKEAYA